MFGVMRREGLPLGVMRDSPKARESPEAERELALKEGAVSSVLSSEPDQASESGRQLRNHIQVSPGQRTMDREG